MTQEEWSAELARQFPAEILNFIRPKDGVETDLPYGEYLPPLISQDPVRYEQINTYLRQLLSNDKTLSALIDAIKNQLADCDLRIVTEALKGLMSPEMLKKLNGIEDGATKYAHPATHPAAIITLDALHRFVTDTQIAKWDNKEEKNHGNHVPALETADNARYLRNDGTFQTITPAGIGITDDMFGLNLLKRNHTYAVGDIAYSKDLPSWARLECVKPGTTDSTDIILPQNVNGGG